MASRVRKYYFKDKSTGNTQGPFTEEQAEKYFEYGRCQDQLVSTNPRKGFKAYSAAFPAVKGAAAKVAAYNSTILRVGELLKSRESQQSTEKSQQLTAW